MEKRKCEEGKEKKTKKNGSRNKDKNTNLKEEFGKRIILINKT